MTDAFEDHPIYKAIDSGGGQTCDIKGVIRALSAAGFAIVATDGPIADRLRTLGIRSSIWPMNAYVSACGEGANAISVLLTALMAVEVELASLTAGEKCEHDVNICWCSTFRALQMAKEARAKVGVP